MLDDRQGYDWDFVAGDDAYEVRYFAEKHSSWVEQANEMINRIGKGLAAQVIRDRKVKG